MKYKHGDILKFKGVNWTYSEAMDVFEPLEKKRRLPTIYHSVLGHWLVDGVTGGTPLAALKSWVLREVRNTRAKLKSVRSDEKLFAGELEKLLRKSWK